MDHVISELCNNGTILQRNYMYLCRKMTISWSFRFPLILFHGKKFGCHNMNMLYPNSCYNEVCYNGTVLY